MDVRGCVQNDPDIFLTGQEFTPAVVLIVMMLGGVLHLVHILNGKVTLLLSFAGDRYFPHAQSRSDYEFFIIIVSKVDARTLVGTSRE